MLQLDNLTLESLPSINNSYVCQLDMNMNVLWAQKVLSNDTINVTNLNIDSEGNIYSMFMTTGNNLVLPDNSQLQPHPDAISHTYYLVNLENSSYDWGKSYPQGSDIVFNSSNNIFCFTIK